MSCMCLFHINQRFWKKASAVHVYRAKGSLNFWTVQTNQGFLMQWTFKFNSSSKILFLPHLTNFNFWCYNLNCLKLHRVFLICNNNKDWWKISEFLQLPHNPSCKNNLRMLPTRVYVFYPAQFWFYKDTMQIANVTHWSSN